jgi:MFS family permease
MHDSRDKSEEMNHVRHQAALAALLAFTTGWVVGVTKLTQILMTTPDGPYPTASEMVATQFLITFGLSKAVGNLLAGSGADMYGRKPIMLAGWLLGAAFSATVLCARSWTVIVASDLLLGLNQALCWSSALFLALDILGPSRRALASGLVETAGYTAIALASPLVDALGVSAAPALHGTLLALCLLCAGVTLFLVRETRVLESPRAISSRTSAGAEVAESGSGNGSGSGGSGGSGGGDVAVGGCGAPAGHATIVWRSGRQEHVPATKLACLHASCLDGGLMACCLVGLSLNFGTAFAWGVMTRWLKRVAVSGGGVGGGEAGSGATSSGAEGALSVGTILLLYSIPKGICQLPAGVLADFYRHKGIGPREVVCAGLVTISASLALFSVLAASTDALAPPLLLGLAAPLAFLLGAGTALAYSPVLAVVAERADPDWRASALGAYRFWRDAGYAVGGLVLGSITDVAQGAPWVAPLLAAGVVLGTALVFARAVDSSVTPGRERAASTCTRNGQVEVAVELADAPPSDVAVETKPSLSYGRLE